MKCDCHVHMVLDGRDWKAAIGRHKEAVSEEYVRQVLAAYRSAGYGYLRDGGDRWGVGALARTLAPEYGLIYKTPLAPIYKKGHYGGFIGHGFLDMRDFRSLVEESKGSGADFLKIMISGLMDFSASGVLSEDGITPDEIREMVHIGKDLGFSVMAHANGARTVEAAAEAGVDSIEHGAYLDGEALHAMVENGTVWVPTLSAIGNLLGKGRFPHREVERILASAMENVKRFGEMGGLIACGSDAGAWAVLHGQDTESVWLEKALGADAGSILARGNRAIMDKF